MGEARPLFKVDHAMTDEERIASLERRLLAERRLRKEAEHKLEDAERNANRFHALLLQERISKIGVR